MNPKSKILKILVLLSLVLIVSISGCICGDGRCFLETCESCPGDCCPTPPPPPTTTSTTTTRKPTTTTIKPPPTTTTSTTTITTTSTTTSTTTTIPVLNLTVHYIDVGQGDSILIETPNNKVILIDGGDNAKGDDVVDYLEKDVGIERIDVLIATHPHADHIGGLDDVIDKFEVDRIYDNGENHTTKTYEDYIERAKEKNYTAVAEDFTLDLDDYLDIRIIVPYDTGGYSSNLNDNSVLTKITYNGVSFLFTGDCEEDCESEVLDADLDSDLLKVGHHGSNTSTSDVFLSTVSPEVAVISVGADNKYGHPSQITLDKLEDNAVGVYRTDLNGTIIITTDGESYSVI